MKIPIWKKPKGGRITFETVQRPRFNEDLFID